MLTTLVHEGRHVLDIEAQLIPPNNPGGVTTLVAEMRSWRDAGEFARINGFTTTGAIRYAEMEPREIAIELEMSLRHKIGGALSDDEMGEAVRRFAEA